jgi:hypothetical protein
MEGQVRGVDISDVKRLQQFEQETWRLKQMMSRATKSFCGGGLCAAAFASVILELQALKTVAVKNGKAQGEMDRRQFQVAWVEPATGVSNHGAHRNTLRIAVGGPMTWPLRMRMGQVPRPSDAAVPRLDLGAVCRWSLCMTARALADS